MIDIQSKELRPKDFIVPMSSDVGFKGALKTQEKFFTKLVSELIGIPENKIIGGKFIDNETINRSDNEPHRKVDLIFRKDNYLINLEANNFGSPKTILQRDTEYIFRIELDDTLKGNNIKSEVNYYQININNIKFEFDKELINRYEMRDIETNELHPYTLIIIDIALYKLNDKEYTKDVDELLIKALKLFNARSEEEYKKIVGNDKILGGVQKFMSEYSRIPEVVGEYDAEEEAKWMKKLDERHAKEEGMVEGIQKNKLKTAKNMLKDKLDIKLISRYTGLTEEEIKSLKL